MSRIVLEKGKQKDFLDKVCTEKNLNRATIAGICNVCERTIRDWRREKYHMTYGALLKLHKTSNVSIPKIIEVLPEYWSTKKASKLGAIRRNELYGNLGTPEGRRKGGINSQKKFRENPDYARQLKIKIRKIIKRPRNSAALSEFIGILLGDGGITDHQVAITFNRETDKQHSIYTQKLIKKLFGISSSIISRKSKNDKADSIVISSKSLVEFLLKKGLKSGHKIRNKIDIPEWIKNEKEYKTACVRGLIDTDGCFYLYKHRVNGRVYNNFAMCFTSHSTLFLESVYEILKELKFRPSRSKQRVYLHRSKDIELYIKTIGSHNPKHLDKYRNYKKERYGRGYNRTVSKTV